MSNFIYTDLTSNWLLVSRFADPGSTLIHVGAYGHYNFFFSDQLLIVFTLEKRQISWFAVVMETYAMLSFQHL